MDRTVEVRQHDQYAIRVDGSGRITLRNRKFLRKFTPAMTRAAPDNRDSCQRLRQPCGYRALHR